MKYLKQIIFIALLFISIPISVHAASGSISVTASSTAVVGNTLTVTVKLSSSSALGSWDMDLSYNSSYLKLTSSTAENSGTYMVGYASNASTYQKTYTFKFQVLKSGSTTVGVNNYLVYGFDESQMSISSSTKTIKLMTQAELEATYSTDNNLKSLSIEGYTLSPEFNADTLEYNVTVPADVTTINILAEKNDSTATISGNGEQFVNEGSNIFEINVQAQNGSIKTYKITVNVEDANPINIKINNSEYTIVKRKDNLKTPNTYIETNVTINDIEVPGYYSEVSGFTLVGIKDSKGTVFYAIYDAENNTYELYNENQSDQLLLYILPITEEKNGFSKTKITILEQSYEALKAENADVYLLYAMDIVTGEKNYYIYDQKNNSYVLYNENWISNYVDQLEKYKIGILGFGGLCIFCLIIITVQAIKGPKKKKVKKTAENVSEEVSILEEKKSKKNKKKENISPESTKKNEKKTEVPSPTKLTNEEAMKKMDDVTKMIENYEKTVALDKKELKEKAKEQPKEEVKEETMFDILGDDKKKKKKKRK